MSLQAILIFSTALAFGGSDPYTLTRVSPTGDSTARGEVQEFKYELANTGGLPLVITSLETTDGHCKTIYPKAPVLPKSKASLVVRCSGLSPGYHSKGVTVRLVEADSGRVFTAETRVTIQAVTECGDVDLSAKGGSLEGIQSGEQAFGTCAYHAATVLFDAERLRKGGERVPRNLTSAISLAYETKKASGKSDLEGGRVLSSLKRLSEKGGCPTEPLSDLKNADFFANRWKGLLVSMKDPIGHSVKSRVYGEVLVDGDRADVNEAFLRVADGIASEQALARERYPRPNQVDSINHVEGVQMEVLACTMGRTPEVSGDRLAALYRSKAYLEFAEKSLKLGCEEGERKRLAWPVKIRNAINEDLVPGAVLDKELAGSEGMARTEMIERVNRNLDIGKAAKPIAISYCSGWVENRIVPPYKGRVDCGGHGAVIAGRMRDPKTGKCLLKVQSAGISEWIESGLLFGNMNMLTWVD